MAGYSFLRRQQVLRRWKERLLRLAEQQELASRVCYRYGNIVSIRQWVVERGSAAGPMGIFAIRASNKKSLPHSGSDKALRFGVATTLVTGT